MTTTDSTDDYWDDDFGPFPQQRSILVGLTRSVESNFVPGRFALAAGLAAYALVALADPWALSRFGPLDGSQGFSKILIIGALIAAVFDVARPDPLVASGAAIVAATFVGSGVLSIPDGYWSYDVVMRLLLVIGDAALVVGLLSFFGRASRYRRQATVDPRYGTIAIGLVATTGVLALTLGTPGFFGESTLHTIGAWLLFVAIVAAGLLIWTRPALVAAGGAALVKCLTMFGESFDSSGVQRWLVQLGLAAIAGVAAWQSYELQQAPALPPDPTRERSTVDQGQPFQSAATQGSPAQSSAPVQYHQPAGDRGFASFGARLGATIVDGLVFLIPEIVMYALLIGAIANDSVPLLVMALLVPVILSLLLVIRYCRRASRTGQTWGCSAANIYIVSQHTGLPVSAWTVFGRNLASIISALPCYLGYLWMLWDPNRQTWHDKMTGTVVVRAVGFAPVRPGTSSAIHTSSPPQQAAPPAAAPTATPEPMIAAVEPERVSTRDPNPESESSPHPHAPPPFESGVGEASLPPINSLPTAGPADWYTGSNPPAIEPRANLAPAPTEADDAPPLARHEESDNPSADVDVTTVRAGQSEIFDTFGDDDQRTNPTIEFSDGRRIIVTSTLVLGRDPFPSPPDGTSLRVPIGDDLLVSKTHLAVGIGDDAALWVEDRNSTNGVILTRDGAQTKLASGVRFAITNGDIVSFGEQSFTIDAP